MPEEQVEVGVEFDPYYGLAADDNVGINDTEEMSEEWQRAAEVNVNDDQVIEAI